MHLNAFFHLDGQRVHLGHNLESGRSTVNGGMGDDNLTITNGATAVVEYFAGDGHDTLEGANEASVLKFGPGLTFEAASFSTQDGNLTIAFADSDGSVTLNNYLDQGVPMIEFSGGRILDASTTIAKAGGDANAYRADNGVAAKPSSEEQSDDAT